MTTYARVVDGVVVEVFVPPGGLSIGSCFVSAVAATFIVAPDDVEQTWTYDGSSFSAPVAPSGPTLAQQAALLLQQPINLVCTSISALNASYPIDAATQLQITGIVASIAADLGLPSSQETFNWPDVNGTAHSWPGPQFIAFAQQIAQFSYTASQVVQGNSSTLPSTTLTIP